MHKRVRDSRMRRVGRSVNRVCDEKLDRPGPSSESTGSSEVEHQMILFLLAEAGMIFIVLVNNFSTALCSSEYERLMQRKSLCHGEQLPSLEPLAA